jgi:cytosine permease
VSQFFPIVPLVMLIVAAFGGLARLKSFEIQPAEGQTIGALAAACMAIQMVVGFFATAGAAGVDFGTAARNRRDVSLGGWFGVALAILVAGGLAVITVAGAHGLNPDLASYSFADRDVLAAVNPSLAKIMLILFAVGSVAPACFCSSIIGNSLSTMIPSLPRIPLTLGGATIGILLAATGVAGNLGAFFGLIGASFGPICGAIVADYLISGKKWTGPREGISVPGYTAWVIGFLVGISNNPLVTALIGTELVPSWHPTAVYSFIVGFIVYAKLAKEWGMEDRTVSLPGSGGTAG